MADPLSPPGHRLRAGVALVRLSAPSMSERWRGAAEPIVGLMLDDVAMNPSYFETWVDALAPVGKSLVEPLRESFRGAPTELERLLAANILARYLSDDVPQLVELALQSSPKQFGVFVKALMKAGSSVGVRPVARGANRDSRRRVGGRQGPSR